MKTLQFLFWLGIVPMVIGIAVGVGFSKLNRDNTFDEYPSPLACHVDNSCSVKDFKNYEETI